MNAPFTVLLEWIASPDLAGPASGTKLGLSTVYAERTKVCNAYRLILALTLRRDANSTIHALCKSGREAEPV